MSSGKILENYQIKINNYSEYNPIDLNLNPHILSPKEIYITLESILDEIYKIHWLLKVNSQFSNNQKLDYCKNERALMIEYLKKLVKRF